MIQKLKLSDFEAQTYQAVVLSRHVWWLFCEITLNYCFSWDWVTVWISAQCNSICVCYTSRLSVRTAAHSCHLLAVLVLPARLRQRGQAARTTRTEQKRHEDAFCGWWLWVGVSQVLDHCWMWKQVRGKRRLEVKPQRAVLPCSTATWQRSNPPLCPFSLPNTSRCLYRPATV